MQVQFLKKFSKDLDKITQPKDKNRILKVIEAIKTAKSKDEIPAVKLIGFDDTYRIRSGDFG